MKPTPGRIVNFTFYRAADVTSATKAVVATRPAIVTSVDGDDGHVNLHVFFEPLDAVIWPTGDLRDGYLDRESLTLDANHIGCVPPHRDAYDENGNSPGPMGMVRADGNPQPGSWSWPRKVP